MNSHSLSFVALLLLSYSNIVTEYQGKGKCIIHLALQESNPELQLRYKSLCAIFFKSESSQEMIIYCI